MTERKGTIPPTAEMLRIREEMCRAENDGRDEESLQLFSLYMDLRRAQVVGQ